MKLLCLYCVMFQYRVGTYKAISELEHVDFELWHGKSVPGSKRNNFEGNVPYRHKKIPTYYLFSSKRKKQIGLPYSPFLFWRLVKYNPDVILTEGASNLIWAFTAFVYAKLFRKKIIWWSLGTLANNKRGGLRGLLQHFISFIECHVDAVFTYSTQGERYFLDEGIPQEKIYKAINVINMQSKIKQMKDAGKHSKTNGFNIAFVGAITKEKCLELLVDVVELLSKKYSDIHLHLIGDGTYKSTLEDYVKGKDCHLNVVFHGRIVDGLNVELSKYQVLVLPGLGGLAIVDGMISSLPIIAGRADGTELDLIENGRNGFVTDTMTKEFLIEKLLYLYNNPLEMTRMGNESYSRITGPFSFEHYMSVFKNCLKYVCNEK